MGERTDRILDDIINRISQAVHPERIILFGSLAWGEADEESDIDLLVIMASNESRTARAVRLGRLFRPRPAPLDILVLTPEEVSERVALGDPFIQDILSRGKVLYEAEAA
jgi:uncharacterized protein